MVRRYREIRHRYADVVCGINDHQMFRDIQALLGYIEALHGAMARLAAREVVELASSEFDGAGDARALTH